MMKKRNILVSVNLEGKKLVNIMKLCNYVFYDDGDHGFRVDFVFEETATTCFVFGMTKNQAIIETFYIDKHQFAELRRTFSTKSTIRFGSS